MGVAIGVAQALGDARMTRGQLHGFFTKARTIEFRISAGTPYAELLGEIATFHRDAANAVSRRVAPELFKRFIDANVPLAMQSERAFIRGFVEHFHSVVAYFRYLHPRR